MQLSVIIVNYNVKYFLEQCLLTVQRALEGIAGEVIVVDNHSVDGSMDHLPPLFPAVKFIVNEENKGFAKANNQALSCATGKYVLFLNPDTLVPEDCFRNCIEWMEQVQDAGALGIRMMDSKGRFLPESKRAFPSLRASFFKLSGLAALFPHSALFNKYALGNLDEHSNHEVDVLAGAFMMVRRALLERLGGFDEAFFMYGEDIDLSFRIRQAGFKNLYFAGSSIIHFKGKSTRKGSFRHVWMFYSAMVVFVRKNYKDNLFSFIIQMAIVFRAMLSLLKLLLSPARWFRFPVSTHLR